MEEEKEVAEPDTASKKDFGFTEESFKETSSKTEGNWYDFDV